MAQPATGPRVLLRQLRAVMADRETAQSKLDRIVALIAANVVAEVCSIYVLREGGVLELYATEGLKPQAVHMTRLKLGEGLVGTIAKESKILNLPDAQVHPAFKYVPETGEEIYSSFLGVPILRNGQPIGVLVVQNRTRRNYSEEEEEALQTTAMVLAEMVAAGDLKEVAEAVGSLALKQSRQLSGEALVDGVALGHVVLHQPRIVVSNYIADSIPDEQVRLEEAIDLLRTEIDELIDNPAFSLAGEHDAVLETVRMFAHDRGWVRRMREAADTGLTAEAAVERVQNDMRARLARQHDPYMRERMHDLDDLSNRLLRILTGRAALASAEELPRDAVIVARNMGPAELLDYDSNRLRGLALEEAGRTSHVAIVARALGLPTVGLAQGLLDSVETGSSIIVDGHVGDIHVRPPPDIEAFYAEQVRFHAKRQARYRKLRDKPAVTRDGRRIALSINAGLQIDIPQLEQSGADGIGLYRTELQFMLSRALPRRSEQIAHYKSVLKEAGKRPVTFRTLDIGADKMLPYIQNMPEENPAMGWRAIRMSLQRPALLKLQIRCLLTASAKRGLKLMFPMIADVGEMRQARDIVAKETAFLSERGEAVPRHVELGVMLEVPSLLWQLEELLDEADFLSIGSNDLLQFLFASDRTHPLLANRYDMLNPAVLRALRTVVETCAARDKPVTVCGEMAGLPLEAMTLIGLGLTSLSMVPSSVGPVKAMVRSLDQGALAAHLRDLLGRKRVDIRKEMAKYAKANGVAV